MSRGRRVPSGARRPSRGGGLAGRGPSLGAFRAGRHGSCWLPRGLSLSASLVRPGGAWRAGTAPPVCRASAGRTCCGVRAARSVRAAEPRRGSRWATRLATAAPRPVAQRESRAAGRRVAGWHRASRLPSLGRADTVRAARGAFCPRGRASARFALGDTARGGRPAACRRARISRGREARGGPAPCLPSAEPRLDGHVAACARRVLSAGPSLGPFRAERHGSC